MKLGEALRVLGHTTLENQPWAPEVIDRINQSLLPGQSLTIQSPAVVVLGSIVMTGEASEAFLAMEINLEHGTVEQPPEAETLQESKPPEGDDDFSGQVLYDLENNVSRTSMTALSAVIGVVSLGIVVYDCITYLQDGGKQNFLTELLSSIINIVLLFKHPASS